MTKEYALRYPDGLLTDEGTVVRAEILDALLWSRDSFETLKSYDDRLAKKFEGAEVVSRREDSFEEWVVEAVGHDELALVRLAKEAEESR